MAGPYSKSHPDDITAARLRSVLEYDAATGLFRWLYSPSNNVRIGAVAGCIKKCGYRYIDVDGRRYRANRLAWLYVTGNWPRNVVDHKNGVPTDDRFENLRDVSQSRNMLNQHARVKETQTGIRGVYKVGSRFRSKIQYAGKLHCLGYFASTADAQSAYLRAKEEIERSAS